MNGKVICKLLPLRKMRLRKDSDSASQSEFQLSDGSRVVVIGGGPAGSLFSYFLLDMADLVGIKINLDIYEQNRL